MSDFNSMLTWREEEQEKALQGDGISRAMPGARTRPYTVIVIQPGSRRMKLTLRAESGSKAVSYARARWPNATVSLDRP